MNGKKVKDCPYSKDKFEYDEENDQFINITSDDYEAERRRMVGKMCSEKGKEEYKKHKETVEWPFGNIKGLVANFAFMVSSI